jgi:hypothetical protein
MSYQFHGIADLLVEGALAAPHDGDPENRFDGKVTSETTCN